MAATILAMPWQYKKADELLDIADRKGFEVERAVLKDHFRLTGPDGNFARQPTGSAAFTLAQAMRFLEEQPDT